MSSSTTSTRCYWVSEIEWIIVAASKVLHHDDGICWIWNWWDLGDGIGLVWGWWSWGRLKSLTHSLTYLNAECCPLCFATRSNTKTSLPCSWSLKVFASTSRRMRLKCSLSTRNRWQLFSFRTMVAALWMRIRIRIRMTDTVKVGIGIIHKADCEKKKNTANRKQEI